MSLSQMLRCLVRQFPARHTRVMLLAVLVAAGFSSPGRLTAQQPPAAKAAKKPKPAADEIPPPEDVTLTTGDNVGLAITYFPGTHGKESIPVILLHAFKGSRKDFIKEGGLAPYLQEQLGCAVVAPDLRGHGESTGFVAAAKPAAKKPKPLSPADITRQPKLAANFVTQDLQAVKEFLWKKNNAEELNIDKLCVVGVGMGASLALDLALYDAMGYEQGRPAVGALKVGRFLKAMVLISPDYSFPGLNTKLALQCPDVQKNIPLMILVGGLTKDAEGNVDRAAVKANDDARRLNELFAKYHPEPEAETEAEKRMFKTLWFGHLDTTLQGTKLLDAPLKHPVAPLIRQFLEYRLVKNPEAKKFVWKERKLPYQ